MTNTEKGGGSRDGDKPPPPKKTVAGAAAPPPTPPSQTLTQIMNSMTLSVSLASGGPPPLPPPPPPPSGVGGGIPVGGGAGGGSCSADISNTRPVKRKSIVVSPEGYPPVCTLCKRRFETPKALFGHLRAHPERPWRGAYPPPGFEDEEMDRADIDLNQPPEESDAGETDGGGGGKRDFDLNKPPNPED